MGATNRSPTRAIRNHRSTLSDSQGRWEKGYEPPMLFLPKYSNSTSLGYETATLLKCSLSFISYLAAVAVIAAAAFVAAAVVVVVLPWTVRHFAPR